MFLEFSKDDCMKDYAKSMKSLWKVIGNHSYTNNSSKLLSLEIVSEMLKFSK